MTPWELVLQHYKFPDTVGPNIPFVPLPRQIEAINKLAPLNHAGHWMDMATGKTFMATACAFYQRIAFGARTVFVILPPNLIIQWGRWIRSLTDLSTGNHPTVTEYVGTPKQRAKLKLDTDFVIVGSQMFRIDYEKFVAAGRDKRYCVIADEGTFLCNIDSQIHEKVYEFCLGVYAMVLTGTPANTPMDAYALIKFTAPGTYRSKRQFENLHVEKYDFWDKPCEWRDLDVLSENLMINSHRLLYEDLYSDTETPLYDPVFYELDREHLKLYRKLGEEQVLALEDGGKIDASKAGRLRHAMGQVVLNWGHFAEDPTKVSQGLELIQQTMDNLGPTGKLVVFAHYKMSVRLVAQHFAKYGARQINSEVTDKQKDDALQAFIHDKACRLIVIQYLSGGKGLDGMQFVSHTVVCIEACVQPRDFHQAIRRLRRPGQRRRVHVIMAIARRTLQNKQFERLIKNDTLINQVVRNAVDLRKEIFGEDGEDYNE